MFSKLLLSFFLNYSEKPEENKRYTHNITLPIPSNFNREILYESFISIDSVLFIMESAGYNETNIVPFLKETVLEVKSLLIENSSYFYQLDNYASKPNVQNKKLLEALRKRNKQFEEDKSKIAYTLSLNKFNDLKERANSNKLNLIEEKKDKEYLNMITRLSKARNGGDGLQAAINREKGEFYREKQVIPNEELKSARISFNLGGSIFIPSVFTGIMKKIMTPNRNDLIITTVSAILKPIEELSDHMKNKTFTEKKDLVLRFLQSCLERKSDIFNEGIEKGFEARTKILDLFLLDDTNKKSKLKVLDKIQDDEIKKLINIFKNAENGDIFIKMDKPVIDAYIAYIDDSGDIAKNTLYKLLLA